MKYKHPFTNEPMTEKDYFILMFGAEFMASNDKGRLREYKQNTIANR